MTSGAFCCASSPVPFLPAYGSAFVVKTIVRTRIDGPRRSVKRCEQIACNANTLPWRFSKWPRTLAGIGDGSKEEIKVTLEHSDQKPSIRWRQVLDIVSSIAVVVASFAVVWVLLLKPAINGTTSKTNPPSEAVPAEPVSLDGAELRGDRGARVALIEYSDFQCPYCSRFANDTLPEIERRYVDSGKVLLAFRHFPLESIHPFALRAAEAAQCAGRQGKFWQMHDALFGSHERLDKDVILQHARALALNSEALSACVDGVSEASVRRDIETGRAIGISGTPAFLVGRIQRDGRVQITDRLSGAKPVEQFAASINKLLASSAVAMK